jgi:sialic acid synthase SpsE
MIDFIAEVSSNHNRDISRMKEFIYAAKDAGCTGVKYQLFKIDQLFSSEILTKSEDHRKRVEWELSEKFIPELAELTHSLDLKFSCTPFYLDAVDFLEPYVDFYKIASYELLWLDLFKKCCQKNKPIVFSTGMATEQEIKKTANYALEMGCNDLTILHCNSAYPTPVEDANLAGIISLNKMINNLKTECNIKVGYSDHTVSPAVMYRSVHHYDAKFIEFHIDLDGKGEEFESGHCWLPDQISLVINNINLGLKADGNSELKPSDSEFEDREWRADPIDGLRPMKKIRDNFKI